MNVRNFFESISKGQVDLQNDINDKYLEMEYNFKRLIHWACEYDQVGIVKILIDKNCNLEIPDKIENWFPIHYACKNGNVRILQMLLDKNCSIESLTQKKMRPIHFACRHGHYKIAKILVDKKCNINVFDQNKIYPIHYASRNGHFNVVKLLIDNKCNINVMDEDFFTPLHYACRRSHADIAKLLIDANINIEAQDGDNWRPLHFACRYGELEIVRMLIDKKCDINARQANKLCGIHHACNHGYFDIVKLLIENGCGIEMCDKEFHRPIHFACQNGHVEIVKLLIEHKCNIESITSDEKSPLKIAKDSENKELIDIIKEEIKKRKQERKLMNTNESIETLDPEIYQMVSLMELKCEDKCDHKLLCPKSLMSRKFSKGKKIGSGTYGKVYKIKGSGRNSTFAVKYISIDHKSDTKHIMEKVNKELTELRHENLVQYFGAIEIEKCLCVFMEFVDGKSLHDVISHKELKESDLIPYSKQILEGLTYLHERNYIHRDLKPYNILVNKKNGIKLVDYDSSRLLHKSDGHTSIATTFCGTFSFVAPEILKENPYTCKADIWSLGATIINMSTGKPIFWDKEENEIIKEVLQEKGFDLSKCDIKPLPLKSLLVSMLENEPTKRPSASELLGNDIFANQDWTFLD